MSLHLCISGFDTKTLSVTGLEEYWPYKFKVTAATVKGNTTSDFSSVFRTTQAGESISVVIFFLSTKKPDYIFLFLPWATFDMTILMMYRSFDIYGLNLQM